MLGSTRTLLQVRAVVNGFDSGFPAWYPQSTAGTSSRLPAACCSLDVRTWEVFWLPVNGTQGQCQLSRHLSTPKMLSLAFSLWTCGSPSFQLEVSYKQWVFAVVSLGKNAVHFLESFMSKQEKKNADRLPQKQRHWNQLVLLQQSRKSQWEKTGSYGFPLRKMQGRLPFWWRIQGQTQQVVQNHPGVCGIQNWILYLM